MSPAWIFLVRPQFRAQLIAKLHGNVEDLGVEKLDNVDTRHFRGMCAKANTHDVYDMWFTAGKQPVLTRLVMTTTMPIDDQRTFQLTTSGTFRWNDRRHSIRTGTFTLAIPAGARRVNDLMAALQGGDIEQLVGKPAPPLELESLQGTTVNWPTSWAERVVVLIFWTSWCVPSSDVMAVAQRVRRQLRKGRRGRVRHQPGRGSREGQQRRDGVRLSGHRPARSGCRRRCEPIGSGRSPITFLIGADGTVQAYQSGSTPEAAPAHPGPGGGPDCGEAAGAQRAVKVLISRFPMQEILGRMVRESGAGSCRLPEIAGTAKQRYSVITCPSDNGLRSVPGRFVISDACVQTVCASRSDRHPPETCGAPPVSTKNQSDPQPSPSRPQHPPRAQPGDTSRPKPPRRCSRSAPFNRRSCSARGALPPTTARPAAAASGDGEEGRVCSRSTPIAASS